MPSQSKSQQRLFGMIYALQTGKLKPSDVSDKINQLAKTIDLTDAKEFASTNTDDLPEKVKTESLLLKFFKINEESSLPTISKNIKVTYNSKLTRHAIERQLRHINQSGTVITNQEIINLIDNAIPKITKQLILNKINIGDDILLTDGYLNIVGALAANPNGEINFIIITLMNKKNFKPKSNTKKINM